MVVAEQAVPDAIPRIAVRERECIGSGLDKPLPRVDKITARVTDIRAPMNKPLRFGSLEITPRTCSKRPPEETPEVTAFVEVSDIKADGGKKKLFSGWMFASSPALSALEHPVYDVWVIDCNAIAPGM